MCKHLMESHEDQVIILGPYVYSCTLGDERFPITDDLTLSPDGLGKSDFV